ncbi:MAG: AmmeMemoRadiSam system protein B [Planctomycetota bacterium]|nr:AmmeMemoRadiSam system protein B [Planctomycetota bacterium]
MDLPRLRADLELQIAETQQGPLLLIRDPEVMALDVAQFDAGIVPILKYFDGTQSLSQIVADLAKHGATVDEAQLGILVGVLDRALLLDSEHFRTQKAARDAFAASPLRPAAHAGAAYPVEATEARAFLDEIVSLADAAPAAPLARLIAPHIDLNLGRDVYAHTTRRLAAGGRPDVVVVLGVNHDFGTHRFVACRKDFETPLGVVPHDAAFIDALEAELGEDLTAGQFAHHREHSIEFQALWLAHLWPDDPPAIVPLLVGSFHEFIETGGTPSADDEVEAFIAALAKTRAAETRRVLVLASVDLAHMGPVYEHDSGLDDAGEAQLERDDRALLEHVAAGRAEDFFAAVAADENARNVCGTAPVYVALRLGEGPGELVRYGQGRIHPESGSVVSFATMTFST